MSNSFVNNINDADLDFHIVINKMDDVLGQIDIEGDDKLLMESIIDNLETDAATALREGKTVSLPLIGCVRKNPIQNVIKDNAMLFAHKRRHLSKEEYKEFVRNTINNAKREIAKEDRRRVVLKKARSNNKEKYDRLYKTIGKVYAEAFIYSLTLRREVPFDPEHQDALDAIDNIVR